MRKVLKNRFIMYKTVNDWLTAKKSELSALHNLAGVHEHLANQIRMIDELDAQTDQTSKGFTSAKSAIRADLEKSLIMLVAYLKNVATFANNVILLHEIDFKDNQLVKASEQMLTSRAEFIVQKSKANEQVAAPFGMTAEHVARAEQLLSEFKAAKTTPRQAVVGSVDVNARLEEAMEETDNLIKSKLDVIMKLIKFEKPTLYGQYKSARVIVDR